MPKRQTSVPKELAGEQVRQRLLDVVDQRWNTPVTTLVAGAGFGKSVLLHQAIRANLAQPQGLDVYLRCGEEHRDPVRLVQAVIDELEEGVSGTASVQDLLDALRCLAPLDVAVVFDDLHALAGSASIDVVNRLIDDLPAHVHLVLLGRELPMIALARLRAADELIELGEDELAFTEDECRLLANYFGRPGDAVPELGGWPALVRLALATHRSAPRQYLHEEVLSSLSLAERQALAALCLVRSAGGETLAEILDRAVESEELARRLPLVTIDDQGRLEAHAIWDDYVEAMVPTGSLGPLRRRAIEVLVESGRLHEAGDLAKRCTNWDALDRIATELVVTTLSVPEVATARAWLADWPSCRNGDPGRLLLAATVSVAEEQTEHADRLIDRALAAMPDETPSRVVFAAVTLSIMGAFHRRDLTRLSQLGDVASRIDDSESNPLTSLLLAMIEACRAAADGDPVSAARHLQKAPLNDVEPATARAAYRFLCVNLTLGGHADQALELVDGPLRRLGHPDNDWVRWISYWQAGNITQYLRYRGADLPHPSDAPSRAMSEAVVAQKLRTIAQACCGDPIDAALALRPIVGRAKSRAVGYQSLAAASLALQQHDEETARQELEQFLQGMDSAAEAELTLRRFLAVGYVLLPGLRSLWDGINFGPTLAPARLLAQALLNGRNGRPVSLTGLTPENVLVSLPLPWSVEVACYLIKNRQPFGRQLLDWLVATLGPIVNDELRLLASSRKPVAASARSLVVDVGSGPTTTTRVGILGPLDVWIDGTPLVTAELRRARVRELLTLLVLEPRLQRDSAASSMWPDLNADRAANNLRVTLSYLRRVLEPDRKRGQASFHLLADSSTLQLQRSDRLETDYWEFVALLDEAKLAQTSRDRLRAATALEAATALWRGDPCPDLPASGGIVAVVEQIKLRYVEALLTAGNIRFTEGKGRAAATAAAAALAWNPFDEAAHRLALAAAVQLRDWDLVRSSVLRLDDALAELLVEPEPATAMLHRQASRWLLAAS